jgi:signal transduction histidine kinase
MNHTSWSIRNRLRWQVSIACTIVLGGAALLIYGVLRARMMADFDHDLYQRAQLAATMVRNDHGITSVLCDSVHMPELLEGNGSIACTIRTMTGHILFRCPFLMTHHAELPPSRNQLATELSTITLPNNQPARLICLLHRSVEGIPLATIAFACDSRSLYSELARLAWLLGSVTALAVAITVLIVDQIARRLTAPITHLAERIAAINPRQEHHQAITPSPTDVPQELAPVVTRLNDLLARLDSTLARERNFSSDVAHELRTPLTGLRTTIDLALNRERSAADYRASIITCRAICTQTQGIIESLLLMARADSGHSPARPIPVIMSEVIAEAWAPLQAKAEARELIVEFPFACDQIIAVVDPEHANLIITNLLTNAVAYTDSGGRIIVRTNMNAGTFTFILSNSGCTLPAEHAPLVFKRFWRGDKARSDTGLHSGLGLALCRSLCELNRGTIDVTIADGIFTVTVTLPAVISTSPPGLA